MCPETLALAWPLDSYLWVHAKHSLSDVHWTALGTALRCLHTGNGICGPIGAVCFILGLRDTPVMLKKVGTHKSQCWHGFQGSKMPTCPPTYTLHSQASLEEEAWIDRYLWFLHNSGQNTRIVGHCDLTQITKEQGPSTWSL